MEALKFQNPMLIHVSSKIIILGARYFFLFQTSFYSQHISGFRMIRGIFECKLCRKTIFQIDQELK